MNWITNYVRPKIGSLFNRREVPENLWTKCAECGSTAYEWAPVTGRGTLYSWTVTHQVFHPAFDVPFVAAVIELDEQLRVELGLAVLAREEAAVVLQLADRRTLFAHPRRKPWSSRMFNSALREGTAFPD